ncbi:MAG: hypothetical protein AABW51_04650 [Nanoarchaeota archaeon]|mgnify:CR=1 FL=1
MKKISGIDILTDVIGPANTPHILNAQKRAEKKYKLKKVSEFTQSFILLFCWGIFFLILGIFSDYLPSLVSYSIAGLMFVIIIILYLIKKPKKK